MSVAFFETFPFADGKFETTPKIDQPITFTLQKDPSKKVTLFPVHDPEQVPWRLMELLRLEFELVVEEGVTYPHLESMDRPKFASYWFQHFAGILVEGEHASLKELEDEPIDFENSSYLGTFYIKPNYIGRSSHVCNAGFMVNHKKRGLGLGKELGRKYLGWAKQLGYAYSVFNLVYETNVASCKIWDSLGFEKIGYVKNVAMLKGQNKLVGAHMYGKDLLELEEA